MENSTLFSEDERNIYALICRSNGIKARDIAASLQLERKRVNQFLYSSALIHELCWKDSSDRWHGLIRQEFPHAGLYEFAGYYSSVAEFMALEEEEWLERLKEGCRNIGRNLNDARGLIHSFLDERESLRALVYDLMELSSLAVDGWEIVFELRLKRSRHIRIYADVLLISPSYVFSMEFKMKDEILPEEVQQAWKYCRYQDLIFGNGAEIVPVLVLTHAEERFEYAEVNGVDASVHVSSADMLYNVIDTYYGFLNT